MSILVEENFNKTKFVKTAQRNNLYAHPLTERNHVFITSLDGERVQQQKKEVKAKKDAQYL